MSPTSIDSLQNVLGLLARQRAVISKPIRSRASKLSRVDRFTGEARSVLGSGFVRYSQRLDLLARAEQLRIPEFDATLIIAALQHQAEQQPRSTSKRSDKTVVSNDWHQQKTIDETIIPELNWPWTAMLVTVSQLAIVTAVWWMMRGLL